MKSIPHLHKMEGLSGTVFFLFDAEHHPLPEVTGILALTSPWGGIVYEVPNLATVKVTLPDSKVLFLPLEETAQRSAYVNDLRAGLAAHPLQAA